MKKTNLLILLPVLFSFGFTKPTFRSLDSADDNDIVAADSVSQKVEVKIEEEESSSAVKEKDPAGFSVRLVSRSSRGRTKIKSQSPTHIKSALVKNDSSLVKNTGDYTIQLSSFLTETEAKSKLGQIQKTLADAWISTAEVGGKTRYRIYSGHFKTMKDAKSAQTKIAASSGVKDAFVQKVFSKITAKNES